MSLSKLHGIFKTWFCKIGVQSGLKLHKWVESENVQIQPSRCSKRMSPAVTKFINFMILCEDYQVQNDFKYPSKVNTLLTLYSVTCTINHSSVKQSGSSTLNLCEQ